MPKMTNGVEHPPRVGVTVNAETMTDQQVIGAIKTSEVSYMEHLWDSCYLFSDLYARKLWTIGLNHRPSNADFVRYVQEAMPDQYFTESDLMTRIDTYNAYASFGREDVVAMVKRIGLTKARNAIPWALRFKDHILTVLEIAGQARDNLSLRTALNERFALRKKKSTSSSLPGGDESGEMVLAYLAKDAEVGMIADQMCKPRSLPGEPEVEFALYALMSTYLDNFQNTDQEMDIDDLYMAMVHAWIINLPADVDRADLLNKAQATWQVLGKLKGFDLDAWPFEDVT